MNMTVNPDREVTEDEYKALVTIETAERLASRAFTALSEIPGAEVSAEIRAKIDEAQALLGELVDETTVRTVTAVKKLALSDRIAGEARERVNRLVAKVGA